MSDSDVLRVILHDEDRHPRPELRVAQGVDNLTESEVVVGDHGLGCRSPRRGSVGVIGRKLAQARPNRGKAASWVFNNLGRLLSLADNLCWLRRTRSDTVLIRQNHGPLVCHRTTFPN